EKLKGIGFSGADAAQEQHVPREHLFPHWQAHRLPLGTVPHEEKVGILLLILTGILELISRENRLRVVLHERITSYWLDGVNSRRSVCCPRRGRFPGPPPSGIPPGFFQAEPPGARGRP